MAEHYNTCLLIDDNYIDNFVTRKVLESSKFAKNIIVRESPFEAIEALRNGLIKPDIIFVDVRMPAMNGFEFLEEFEKLPIAKEGVKIFMLSSSLDPTDMRRSFGNKQVTQFLHKPITQKVLEDLVP
jgi:CheY-like chemotaxis protein